MKNNLKKFTSKLSNKKYYTAFSIVCLIFLIFLVYSLNHKPEVEALNQKIFQSLDLNLPLRPKVTAVPLRKSDSRDPNILARQYGLLDVESGTLVFSEEADKSVPIASVTKIMTAILTVEHYDLNRVIEVSQKASQQIGSTIGLKSGEKITVGALLNGLLINSGNDTAYTLAENYLTSEEPNLTPEQRVEKFILTMNTRAKELGLDTTQYFDPAGLSDDGRSTVRDQGRLIAYALNNAEITKIIHKAGDEIKSVDGKIVHKLDNSNRLVKEEMLYPGIIGGKTGFTPTAGHNLITAARRDGHTLIAIIINTHQNTNTASAIEAKKLLDWGYTNLVWEQIF